MTTTENYSLKLAEGSDLVNPLVIDNPNYETIDAVMKDNADNGIPRATELATGTVHALTRTNPDASVFHFTATSNFTTGDTFTVDNTQVTALLPSGLPLATGAYIIGSEVICALRDTLLTVFVSGNALLAEDSERLGGELPTYYATQSDMDSAEDSIDALGTITTDLDNRVSALEVGGTTITVTANGVKTYNTLFNELLALVDITKVSERTVLTYTTPTGIKEVLHIVRYDSTALRFSEALCGTTNDAYINYIGLASAGSGGSYWYRATITTSTSTTNVGTSVAPSGTVISIKY